MKKRLLSILLMCCMVLTLLPTAAFAEGSEEELPVCTCETACTAESLNADCPVCGAEDALPENCAKREVSAPQPEAALTALSGEGETPAASGAVTDVSTAADLTAAISNPDVNTVRLAANIDISNTLTVNRTVTLDLNGYALTVGGTELDIFSVDESGNLTVKDSGTGGKIDGQNKNCGFCIYGGVLTLESGTIINCMTDGDGSAVDISSGDSEGVYGKFVMNGGAITNCKATDDGGAVDIGKGCTFIMNSGTISGCRADDDAGAIFIKGNASFVMNGGTIENCSAGFCGGAVKIRNTSSFTMTGGTISNCTAQQGGGVYVGGSSTFNMNGGSIANCTATNGGNSVFVMSGTGGKFTMTDGTVDGSVTLHFTVAGSDVYMDGLGTAAYPYQISTADQLKLFRDKVNDAKTKEETKICAVLTADIDLKNEEWTPIGIGNGTENNGATIDFPYSGTFDGNGHTISGLNVNYRNKNGGLFCYVMNATIKNLTVAGSVTHSSGDGVAYGGIVGCADSSTIENCTNRCTVTGNWYAGGIVGWSTDSDIIGCANFGNISSPSFSGGICGKIGGENDAAGIDATIRDCYNVGMVSGNYAGGITGQSDSEDIDILIANCYNVGSLHGSTNTGEIIGDLSGPICTTIDNCYYLPTGNPASTSDRVNVKRTDSKTAAEFADGTVRKLLKAGERDNNADPWADECQYLAAADKTLPVFNGQGDAHDHQSNDWEHNDTEHWQVCTCGAVFHKAEHSGGTATCTAKATCADCGAEYGNHHGDKLKHVVAKDATTSEEGNIEYWYCKACEKYFSDADANNEISQAQTVIPKRQSSGSNYSYYTIKATAGTGGSISPSGSISVREGRDQTFTITPDKGYAVANVKIDGKSIGAVKSYTFENVRRTHTIEVIFMKANGNPQTGVFVDVATGSYYEDAVDWAVENGITQGTDDTHFSPDGICTRAQAVTFLWRAAGSPKPETRAMPFTDVPVGSYYYDAVLWAVENGITKGTSDTTFSPNATCSRAQIVAFLWRSQKSPAVGSLNPFTDVSANAYYTDAVLWAVEENITKGTTATMFSPDADCSRAQIVTLLYRAYVK